MEKRVLKNLKKLVDKHGPAKVAVMINEFDTQALKRWLKEDRLPTYKVNLISDYLRRNKWAY